MSDIRSFTSTRQDICFNVTMATSNMVKLSNLSDLTFFPFARPKIGLIFDVLLYESKTHLQKVRRADSFSYGCLSTLSSHACFAVYVVSFGLFCSV